MWNRILSRTAAGIKSWYSICTKWEEDTRRRGGIETRKVSHLKKLSQVSVFSQCHWTWTVHRSIHPSIHPVSSESSFRLSFDCGPVNSSNKRSRKPFLIPAIILPTDFIYSNLFISSEGDSDTRRWLRRGWENGTETGRKRRWQA